MDEDDIENEILNSKHPLIAKTKRTTRGKNQFRGIKKRTVLIGLGILLTLATVVTVLCFVYDAYSYIEDDQYFTESIPPKPQLIYLMNWHEKVFWSTGNCYVQSIEHLDWREFEYPAAVILNVSRGNANAIWLPRRTKYSPFIGLAVAQQQILLESNLAEVNRHNASNPFKRFDFALTYDAESNIMWRKYQVKQKHSNQLYVPGANNMSVNGFTNLGMKGFFLSQFKYSFPVAMTVINGPCNGTRNALVQELAKHMEVHIYGNCSERRCADNTCNELPIYLPHKRYKFYLAFENEGCSNHISDDFYKALGDTVPVVYGDADYSIFAPPSSYIDASTFRSMSSLAYYLKRLDDEPEKYINYFAWLDKYKISANNNYFQDICDLMSHNFIQRKLNFEEGTDRYHSHNWWEKAKCQHF